MESEEADRRIDLERLLEQAIGQIANHHRQPVHTLLPYIAQGWALKEAARMCGIGRSKAEHARNALRKAACEVANEPRSALKGKGTSARTDEYDEIRKLAARGVSLSKIAAQLRRSENFVKVHFEAATGYRRISQQSAQSNHARASSCNEGTSGTGLRHGRDCEASWVQHEQRLLVAQCLELKAGTETNAASGLFCPDRS